MYDFTACIVTYNTNREDLSQIISYFQKTKLKFKLWISDNSEEDSLRSFINNFSDDRIEYIFNNSNNGFGSGHNVVLKKLMDNNFKEKAEFHIILNADITFEENTIEKMVDYMRKNPEIGQIGPKIYESSGEVNKSCRLLPTPLNLIFRRFFPIKSIVDKMDYNYEMRWCDYNSIMEVPILSGCLMFIRTDILKTVGMFDTRYFMYMEDYDLCRRIGQKYKVIFYPEAEIIHEHGKASYKTRKMMMAHINSAIKYFNKWGWFFDKERKIRNRECIKRYKK